MLRKLITSLCLAALLVGSGVCWAADFTKGHDAYSEGDYATALKEWMPLAEQGNVGAQYFLGLMCLHGRGVPQDYVRAHMWWNLSASTGIEAAIKLRDGVAEVMTPSQIEKAQDLALGCVVKNYKGCS